MKRKGCSSYRVGRRLNTVRRGGPTLERPDSPMSPEPEDRPSHGVASRRTVLKSAGALATALATLELTGRATRVPVRLPLADAVNAAATLPDIQHDIGNYIAPAQTINGVPVRFGPINTTFLTAP